jgi:hypothetical protein
VASDDTLSVREARTRYFAANGFGDGGYDATWVKLKAGPIPLYFPNTPARVRAVRFHDLHHVATSYATTWLGEAEIGAWEIASSCADHYAAWILNLQAFAIGLFLSPAALWRAFVRGRQTRNLYRGTIDDALLDGTVATLRSRLALDRPRAPARFRDAVGFAVWSVLALATLAATAALFIVPVVALVRWLV